MSLTDKLWNDEERVASLTLTSERNRSVTVPSHVLSGALLITSSDRLQNQRHQLFISTQPIPVIITVVDGNTH